VTVAADARFSNVISNAAVPGGILAGATAIGTIAPIGSKLMVSGFGQAFGIPTLPPIPSGRILTVSDIIDDFTVEVVGELTLIPVFDYAGSVGTTFDVWVFPPAFESGFLGRESPVLDWRVPL
jgi:hypothetical protein